MLFAANRPVCLRCQLMRVQQHQQTRSATLIKRPKRPYTFTQLITLSDGSTFLHRTTSPAPVYRATKDTKNSILWNPSSLKLLNVEEDEAGRLKKFRGRFGRGWDAEANLEDGEEVDSETDSLLDLMTASSQETEKKGKAAGVEEEEQRSGKSKGGVK